MLPPDRPSPTTPPPSQEVEQGDAPDTQPTPKVDLPRASRRKWVIAGVLIALPVIAILVAPMIGARLVRSRGLPALEAKLGRHVTLGAVHARWGSVDLEDLVVEGDSAGDEPPVRLPHVHAQFAILPLLTGHVELGTVTIDHPVIVVIRAATGSDNISSLIDRLRAKKPDGAAGGGGHVAGPTLVQINDGSLTASDEDLGEIDVARWSAQLRRDGACHAELGDARVKLAAGPSATATHARVDFTVAQSQLVGLPSLAVDGGGILLWKGFSLSGVTGFVKPIDDPAKLAVDLKGGYGGVDRVLWDAKGWLRPATREGEVDLNAARFDLSQLKPILDGTPVIDPESTEVDASLRLRYQGNPKDLLHVEDKVAFDGHFHLSGLSLFQPLLGPMPVRRLGFDAAIVGELKPKQRRLRIERATFDYRGVHATIAATAEKLGKQPAVDVTLDVAPVSCQTALAALPMELTPALQGFRMQGVFKTNIHLAVDLSDLDQGVDLGGNVGIDGCKVIEAPELVDAVRLQQPFDHAVQVEPGEWLAFIVGPDNPDWVPFADISPHVINSIMTTEDSTFLRHRGFIPSEFRSALKSNLERGYFRLGASSITMQMVKNVLLSREKTLSRKLQELFLTWYVEKNLTKERILEIYFNVVEFGPGIYGIGRAARHYFGKPAKDLTPRESAWFSSIMPNPKRRYVHFCKGAPDAKWELYLNRILKRSHERGRITDAEWETALGQHLTFNRAEATPEKECLDMIKRITTPLPEAPKVAVDGDEPDPQ